MMVHTKVGGCINRQISPTNEPIKFDLKRSMDSFRESFPSGEITKMMLIKVHMSSYSGNLIYKSYPIIKPSIQRVAYISNGEVM